MNEKFSCGADPASRCYNDRLHFVVVRLYGLSYADESALLGQTFLCAGLRVRQNSHKQNSGHRSTHPARKGKW